SVFGGVLLIGDWIVDWLSPVVGTAHHESPPIPALAISLIAVVVVACGVAIAWMIFGRRPIPVEAPTDVSFVTRAARVDLYGDAANEELFVKPGYGLVHGVMAFDGGVVDGGTVGTGSALAKLSAQGRMLQNGFVRSYALVLLAGAALVLLALLVVTW
ncbi:MAG TPA: NADH-quinone oxidoreductase subunit L, partial [Marmoricola sp.]